MDGKYNGHSRELYYNPLYVLFTYTECSKIMERCSIVYRYFLILLFWFPIVDDRVRIKNCSQ